MAQQDINLGSYPNDPTASTIQAAFTATQHNFDELYANIGNANVYDIIGNTGINVNKSNGIYSVGANFSSLSVISSTNTISFANSIGGSTNNLFPYNNYVVASSVSVLDLNVSNVVGANVTGAVPYANIANSVAGANVSGAVPFALVANSVSGSNVVGTVPFALNANYAGWSGNSQIANVAITVAGANVTDQVRFANVAYNVDGANVSGIVANANYANSADSANVSLFVAEPIQTVITKVGTLTSLAVDNTITANSVDSIYLDGSLTSNSASQPNITTVGNLLSLRVLGNINATSGFYTGNVNAFNLSINNAITTVGATITGTASVGNTLVAPKIYANSVSAAISLNAGNVAANNLNVANLISANVIQTSQQTNVLAISNPVVGGIYYNNQDNNFYGYTRDGWKKLTN